MNTCFLGGRGGMNTCAKIDIEISGQVQCLAQEVTSRVSNEESHFLL